WNICRQQIPSIFGDHPDYQVCIALMKAMVFPPATGFSNSPPSKIHNQNIVIPGSYISKVDSRGDKKTGYPFGNPVNIL
ncbi:MAG: hypothetical protein ACQETJ_11005, partial [Bacteroidota bacterium]